MNAMEQLQQDVLASFPAVQAKLDPPDDTRNPWWLDLILDEFLVNVEWRPDRGFGISAAPLEVSENEWGYGEGPEEVFSSFEQARARILELLQKKERTRPPRKVWLRELRAKLNQTQVDVARKMGVQQAAVSKLERRGDVTLATLRRYIEAMGGQLEITARFPDEEVNLQLDDLGP